MAMKVQTMKYAALPTVQASAKAGYIAAATTARPIRAQKAGPRPMVCGPSRLDIPRRTNERCGASTAGAPVSGMLIVSPP